MAIGRAITWRNSRKVAAFALVAFMVVFLLSMIISAVFLLLTIIIIVELMLYNEYSSRNMADNIRSILPIGYEFYEDGLIEAMSGESKTILYKELSFVKIDTKNIVLAGKKDKFIIVIPKCLVDEKAIQYMTKLQRIIGKTGR